MTTHLPDPAPQSPSALERELAEAQAEIARLRRELAEGLARESATGDHGLVCARFKYQPIRAEARESAEHTP